MAKVSGSECKVKPVGGGGSLASEKTRLQVIGKIADFLISYRKRIREMGTNVTK